MTIWASWRSGCRERQITNCRTSCEELSREEMVEIAGEREVPDGRKKE